MAIGTPVHMLSAAVADTTNTTTIAGTTDTVVPSGAMIVAFVANRVTNNTALSTFSDGGTNSYTVVSDTTTLRGVGIAYGYATSGLASGATLTGTLGLASTRKVMDAFYVTGLQNTAHDISKIGDASTGNPDTGTSATTTNAEEIILAAFSHAASGSGDTGTPGGSYNQLTNLVAGTSSFLQGYFEYLIVSSLGTQDASFTGTSTTTGYSALLIGLKGLAPKVFAPTIQSRAINRAANW